MKTKNLLIVFLIIFSYLHGYEDKIERTFKSGKETVFRLANVNGMIEIVTHHKNEIFVRAIKVADNESKAESVKIIFDRSDNKLNIYTERLKKDYGTKVNFFVKVPENIEKANLTSVNGRVEISGQYGDLNARTVNGKIEFMGVFSDSNFSSVNGNVNIYLKSDLMGNVSVNTVNGNINMELGKNSSFSIRGSSVNGNMKSDFDISIKKRFVGSKINGLIGEGKFRIYINTVNGDFKLLRV